MDEPLGRPDEVAAFLRYEEDTLKKWRRRGFGPRWIKVGGRDVRYRWADVREWLDQQSRGTGAAA